MTSSQGRSHVEESLAQVRTAYRLLHAYHRRLFDLLEVTRDAVVKRFGELPSPSWGPSLFAMPPRGSAAPMDCYVQRFIPLQTAFFQWASSAEPKAGSFYLWIQHVGDDALVNAPKNEEPDPATFAAAETSRTTLIVAVVAIRQMNATAKLPDWNVVDKRIRKSPGVTDAHWTDERVHVVEASDATIAFAGFEVDVAAVATRASAHDRFVQPILALIEQVCAR